MRETISGKDPGKQLGMPERQEARGTNVERRAAREKIERWKGADHFSSLEQKETMLRSYLKQ